jgi:hypothetical protein
MLPRSEAPRHTSSITTYYQKTQKEKHPNSAVELQLISFCCLKTRRNVLVPYVTLLTNPLIYLPTIHFSSGADTGMHKTSLSLRKTNTTNVSLAVPQRISSNQLFPTTSNVQTPPINPKTDLAHITAIASRALKRSRVW